MPDFLDLRRDLATCTIATNEGDLHITYRPGFLRSPKALRLRNMAARLEAAQASEESDEVIALFDELVAFLPRAVTTWDLPEYPGGPMLDPHSEDLFYQGYDTLMYLFNALFQEAASGPKPSTPEPQPRLSPGSGGARPNRAARRSTPSRKG